MSLPQFKELCVMKLEEQIRDYTMLLVETQQADHATLRGWQGRIAGLREAKDIINDMFKKAY